MHRKQSLHRNNEGSRCTGKLRLAVWLSTGSLNLAQKCGEGSHVGVQPLELRPMSGGQLVEMVVCALQRLLETTDLGRELLGKYAGGTGCP